MAKKKKAATTRKTTTTRKPMTMAQSAKKSRNAPTAVSGRGQLTNIGKPVKGVQKAAQEKVSLFRGGNRAKPNLQAAKKGNMTFFDAKGKRVPMKEAARKNGLLRTGYKMRLSGGGGRTTDVFGGATG